MSEVQLAYEDVLAFYRHSSNAAVSSRLPATPSRRQVLQLIDELGIEGEPTQLVKLVQVAFMRFYKSTNSV